MYFSSVLRPASSTYKWWVVAMLWWICFFNYADRQSMYVIFPALREEFGFDPVQLGLIGSAFMWVYAAGAPLAGFICDRLSRKTLILGGCLFWSGITMLTGSCSRLWQFVTVRALEGLGETFYFPASMALLSDYHARRTRSRALAFHQSSVYIGTILGSGIGAWVAMHYGWRIGFYWFGGMGIVLVLALYCFLREPLRGAAESINTGDAASDASPETPLSIRETWHILLRTPVAPLLMLAFVGANLVATIFLTWTPTFLVEKFGFKLAAAGVSGVLFIHLASAISVPIAGRLAGWPAGRPACPALYRRPHYGSGAGLAGRRGLGPGGGRNLQRRVAVDRDDRVRRLQGLLRFRHFRRALRCRGTPRPGYGGGTDERRRLGRRCAGAAMGRSGYAIRE